MVSTLHEDTRAGLVASGSLSTAWVANVQGEFLSKLVFARDTASRLVSLLETVDTTPSRAASTAVLQQVHALSVELSQGQDRLQSWLYSASPAEQKVIADLDVVKRWQAILQVNRALFAERPRQSLGASIRDRVTRWIMDRGGAY